MFGADDADRRTHLEHRAHAVGPDGALLERVPAVEVHAVEDSPDRRRTIAAVDDPGLGVGEGDGDGNVGHVAGESLEYRSGAACQTRVEVDVVVEGDRVLVGIESGGSAPRPGRRHDVADAGGPLRSVLQKVGASSSDTELLVPPVTHVGDSFLP